MARIPAITRESIPEDQRAVFDVLVQDRGEVPTSGPASVLFNAPEVAQRGLELARYLRTDTSLQPRIRELAMLLTAREKDCLFIWNAHAPVGRKEGLSDELVDSLRDKKDLPDLAPDEAATMAYGRELFRGNRVSQSVYNAALAQFGVGGLTELTSLFGCYTMLAFNVNAFDVDLPQDHSEPALPV